MEEEERVSNRVGAHASQVLPCYRACLCNDAAIYDFLPGPPLRALVLLLLHLVASDSLGFLIDCRPAEWLTKESISSSGHSQCKLRLQNIGRLVGWNGELM